MRSRIGEAIRRAGRSQVDVARALGVHKVTVCRWCTDRGIRSVSLGRVEAIAEELGTDPGSLLDWSEGRTE